MIVLLTVLAVTTLTGMLVTPLVIRLAVQQGMLDAPVGGRRIHTRAVPRVGGVAVCVATTLGLLVAAAMSGKIGVEISVGQRDFITGIVLGGGILFVAGLVDDLRGLRPSTKLAAQCVAALIVYAFGFRVDGLSLGADTHLSLGLLSLPLTVLWVVGVTNAFNLIDGLDGLATGIALVALVTTLAVALSLQNAEVVIISAALIGSLLGFLRYNFNPARIFLGDSGSLLVGFMLAVLSVHGSQMSATAVLAIVPLFALALPLFDTFLAMVRRWLRGVPLSEADTRHIHHQLLALGLTHRRAVFVLYTAASALAVIGLSIVFAPPRAVLAISAAGGAMSLLLVGLALRHLRYHEFVEAGQVIMSGVLRIRRVIGDQIHARDISEVIARAESIQQINAILEDNAANFGFLHMELCREGSGGRFRINGNPARTWKLDYPVTPSASDHDPHVLRIWCHVAEGFRPFGAERVARILAPVIEARMVPAPSDALHLRVVGGPVMIDGEGMPEPPRERAPVRLPRAARTGAVEPTVQS